MGASGMCGQLAARVPVSGCSKIKYAHPCEGYDVRAVVHAVLVKLVAA